MAISCIYLTRVESSICIDIYKTDYYSIKRKRIKDKEDQKNNKGQYLYLIFFKEMDIVGLVCRKTLFYRTFSSMVYAKESELLIMMIYQGFLFKYHSKTY